MPEITVTAGDLANGRSWPSGNHLARAVRRAFPDAWWVTAGERVIEVTGKDGTRGWDTPTGASLSLAASLDGHHVAPFSFTLPAEPAFSVTARRVA